MTPAELRAWRSRMGLEQITAAKLLGIGRRTYQRYEGGEVEPPRFLEFACRYLEKHH